VAKALNWLSPMRGELPTAAEYHYTIRIVKVCGPEGCDFAAKAPVFGNGGEQNANARLGSIFPKGKT
jgi:hypothetical protein